jgi:DNA mismatch endonuclease (patch repair protein)
MAEDMKRIDPLNAAERSARMSKVKAKGNASTEQLVERALRLSGIDGWVKHPGDIGGNPDFYFPAQRTALFVDGCFWHGCPRCDRRLPRTRRRFWRNKIDDNRARDVKVRRRLRRLGYHAMSIWEHDVKKASWLGRLRAILARGSLDN